MVGRRLHTDDSARAWQSAKQDGHERCPGRGRVAPVMIEGAGFGNTELGTQVLFGGVPARDFEVENDGLIKAITPPGTKGAVDVSVVTRGQTQTLPAGFT